MDTVKVSKAELLAVITGNRDEHRTVFLQAQQRYREAMIAELDRMLQEARDGHKIRRAFTLPEPVDYTESYDTAIEMLGWEVEDTVELDRRDFERFVLNKWEWAGAFAGQTMSYLKDHS